MGKKLTLRLVRQRAVGPRSDDATRLADALERAQREAEQIADAIRRADEQASVFAREFAGEHAATRVEPPRIGKWLTVLTKAQGAEAILGDLEELFHRDCLDRGVNWARRRYVAQVLSSLVPLVVSAIRRAKESTHRKFGR